MRKVMNDLLRGLARGELADRSARVAARLTATDAWRAADAVLTFLSMPHEIETAPIIAAARTARKTVAVPLMDGDDIRFVVLPPEAGELPRDRWGIPVPDPAWAAFEPARAARPLVTTPGLAFDRHGNRLGRGKGFYDRFLTRARADCSDLIALGICFEAQLVDAVPYSSRDRPVDGVVTEETVVMRRP